MLEFGFLLVLMIFFGLGFLFLHKKLEEIVAVLNNILRAVSKE